MPPAPETVPQPQGGVSSNESLEDEGLPESPPFLTQRSISDERKQDVGDSNASGNSHDDPGNGTGKDRQDFEPPSPVITGPWTEKQCKETLHHKRKQLESSFTALSATLHDKQEELAGIEAEIYLVKQNMQIVDRALRSKLS